MSLFISRLIIFSTLKILKQEPNRFYRKFMAKNTYLFVVSIKPTFRIMFYKHCKEFNINYSVKCTKTLLPYLREKENNNFNAKEESNI